MEYMHVIEVTKQNGVSGCKVIRTFVRRSAMMKWVEKNGRPIWMLRSDAKDLSTTGRSTLGTDHKIQYWNSGAGWQWAAMPTLPFHG